MRNQANFERFVSGNGLLNTTLSIGVIFLMHTYTKILWKINPSSYNFDLGLNVVESLFFGFVTFLVIRRANNMLVKVVFAFFEFCAVFIFYNQLEPFYLTTYIALLSASSIFALGYISLESYKAKLVEEAKEEEKTNSEILRLTTELASTNSKLLQLESDLEDSNIALEHSEKEVTHLRDKVTSLQNEVTQVKTSLLSELEASNSAKDRVIREFRAYREKATEWERGWLKLTIANEKRKMSNKDLDLIEMYETRLNELGNE